MFTGSRSHFTFALSMTEHRLAIRRLQPNGYDVTTQAWQLHGASPAPPSRFCFRLTMRGVASINKGEHQAKQRVQPNIPSHDGHFSFTSWSEHGPPLTG